MSGEGNRARAIALAVPLALLAGAYVSQYLFGLFPCEMCWWQRYAHFAALALAALALLPLRPRLFTLLAGLAILTSAGIGLLHAGVEYKWWAGFTRCASMVAASGNPLDNIMNAPVIACDQPQWTLLGISLAGFNFLFSGLAALAIFHQLTRSAKPGA